VFPRLVIPLEKLAGYRDDHDTSLEMGNGEQMPCTVEQHEDHEDGVWRASVQFRPSVAAFGEGATREAAPNDLRSASDLLISAVGPRS
jgi:hypothetical protein